MKTMMNTTKTCLLLLMALFLALGCSSDDDTPPPDPRADFVDTFEMEDFEMRIVITNSGTVALDSVVTVTDHPEIEFLMEEDLGEDELKAELKEFMETLWERLYSSQNLVLTATFETEDEVIAEIPGDDFNIDGFDSKVTLSDGTNTEMLEFDFGAEGELEEGELTMEFELIYSEPGLGSLELTGTAIGEKE